MKIIRIFLSWVIINLMNNNRLMFNDRECLIERNIFLEILRYNFSRKERKEIEININVYFKNRILFFIIFK